MTGWGRGPERNRDRQTPDPDVPPDDDNDWTVVWGKRLGRTVGFGLAVYLLWYLISTYGAAP